MWLAGSAETGDCLVIYWLRQGQVEGGEVGFVCTGLAAVAPWMRLQAGGDGDHAGDGGVGDHAGDGGVGDHAGERRGRGSRGGRRGGADSDGNVGSCRWRCTMRLAARRHVTARWTSWGHCGTSRTGCV